MLYTVTCSDAKQNRSNNVCKVRVKCKTLPYIKYKVPSFVINPIHVIDSQGTHIDKMLNENVSCFC